MDLWQEQAACSAEALLCSLPGVLRVRRAGSLLSPETLDRYSDVDLHIDCAPSQGLEVPALLESLQAELGPLLGYEVQEPPGLAVLRLCFAGGWRFDLTFHDIGPTPKPQENAFPDQAMEDLIHSFWFVAALILTKLGRRDFLIAAHLALELCQMDIVLQMMRRDQEKGTTIHRQGAGEGVPVLAALDGLPAGDTETQILRILWAACHAMQRATDSCLPAFAGRLELLRDIAKELGFEEPKLDAAHFFR